MVELGSPETCTALVDSHSDSALDNMQKVVHSAQDEVSVPGHSGKIVASIDHDYAEQEQLTRCQLLRSSLNLVACLADFVDIVEVSQIEIELDSMNVANSDSVVASES